MTRRFVLTILFALTLTGAPAKGAGQSGAAGGASGAGTANTPADTTPPADFVSPRAAFIRSAVLPGWGHASIGSYNRGGFYFAAEATVAWGFLRTRARLREVRARIAFREEALRAELEGLGGTPEEVEAALADDEILLDLGDLEVARRDEREDWAALGIFLIFLSGADAYVSAHLKDFPAPLELESGAGPDGRMEVGFSLRLPRR